jgi:hypothetical protein
MRLYRIWPLDIEAAVTRSTLEDADEHGNRRVTGSGHDGRTIIVVIAADDPDFVITIFPDD